MNLIQFVHSPVDGQVSSFYYYKTCYKCLCGQILLFLLTKYLQVELLGYVVDMCLSL